MSWLHLGIELFFISVGFFALASLGRDLLRYQDAIWDALQGQHQPQYHREEIPPAGYEIVTCGGCGKSVSTDDGFNPTVHDCDGIDNSLLAK